MRALVEVFIALIELIKVELKQSKAGLFQFIIAVAFFAVGVLFSTAALGLLLTSIGLALAKVLPVPLAIALTGAIALVTGLILIFYAKSKARY